MTTLVTAAVPVEGEKASRRFIFSPASFLLASVFFFLATAGALALAGSSRAAATAIGAVGFGICTISALLGVMRSIAALVRTGPGAPAGWRILANIIVGLVSLGMAAFGGLVTMWATMGFSRGRQLRRFGRVLLPGLVPNADWAADSTITLDGDVAPPAGLAQQWRENGKTEHASVAAFARLTLDLMALGAPPALIAAANQDALDEIRHTQICFSLARAIDGRSESPGPFPEAQRVATLPRSRSLALATLAVDSLVDGALNEGVSARIIAKLARRAEVAEIRERLKEIAADEGRHAAHGWDVIEWCLAEGGTAVADALRGSIRALPLGMESQMPEASRSGAWERWGIHGSDLEAAEYAAARAQVVARVGRMLPLAKVA
jgi:hypothetical protein